MATNPYRIKGPLLTAAQRVERACQILGPKADRVAIEAVIKRVTQEEARRSGFDPVQAGTKEEKAVARKVALALADVEDLLQSPKLQKLEWLFYHYPTDREEFGRWRSQLKHYREWAAAWGAVEKKPANEQETANKGVLFEEPPKQRKRAIVQRIAADAAVRLLQHHGVEPKISRQPEHKIHKLSAVLFGYENADLFTHYQAVINRLKRG